MACAGAHWCGVGCAATRCCFVRSAATFCYGMSAAAASRGMETAAPRRSSASACEGAIGRIAATAAIVSAAAIDEPMLAPAVVIAPAGPGAHAEEDPVIKIAGPVKSHGRAGVGGVVIIAVGTNRLNADANADLNLRMGSRCENQACGQECR